MQVRRGKAARVVPDNTIEPGTPIETRREAYGSELAPAEGRVRRHPGAREATFCLSLGNALL